MAFARTDTLDQRSAILHRLTTRNHVVGFLRVLVPAAGVAAFLLLVMQIYVANTLRQYGVAGIRIDRGALVVDSPRYSAVGSNGAHYTASAREAHTPINDTQIVAMDDADLAFERPGEPAMHLTAPLANADTGANIFAVPGTATLTDDAGLHGTLQQLEVNVQSGVTLAKGPVALIFSNGSTLDAANMRYDSKTDIWTFEQVTFVSRDLPQATP